jgi:hypothetical protein
MREMLSSLEGPNTSSGFNRQIPQVVSQPVQIPNDRLSIRSELLAGLRRLQMNADEY